MSVKIVYPVIHLNGTSRTELCDQLDEVYHACRDVLRKLKAAAPNGRDYYPAPGRMELAVAQHNRRMKVVTDLMAEIGEQCEAMSIECTRCYQTPCGCKADAQQNGK